jgi:hypothetical protein
VKWEYLTELFNHREGGFLRRKTAPTVLTDRLNQRADDGWELVSTSEAGDRYTILLIFRRQLST